MSWSAQAYELWNKSLLPALAKEGIHVHSSRDLSAESLAWSEKYFREEIYPTLTPLAVDPSHPFPQLANKSHNLIVALNRPHDGHGLCHRADPAALSAAAANSGSPSAKRWGPGRHYVFLQGIIRRHLSLLFPASR